MTTRFASTGSSAQFDCSAEAWPAEEAEEERQALVLVLMLVVTSRLLYGFWRAWMAWRSTGPGTGWLAEAGLAGSLAAGALVLGYTLTYWAGVQRRLLRERRAPSR